MAIDGVGWDWSYMANEGESHALVANEEAPTEFTLMANTKSKVFDNSFYSNKCKKNTNSLNSKIKDLKSKLSKANNYIYHYKLAVAQLEGRLTEYKEREVKYIEKVRTIEMYRASNLKCIKTLDKKLEELKLEKDGLDGKLAGLLKASKNLDHLIKSQRSDQVKEGVGYNVVPPPAADLYLSPKKNLSWTGLPKFVDDTVTDYSRPSPTIASTSVEGQNKDSSTSEDVTSPNPPKPFVKFVKPKDSQPESKSKEQETPKKSQVKYVEQYRHSNKKPKAPSYETRPFLKSSAVRTQYRASCVPTVNRNNPPVSRKFSTGRRNFPMVTRKFPTASRKFTTGSTKNHTADMGRKGKAATYPIFLILSHLMEDMCLLVKEDARLQAREPLKPRSDQVKEGVGYNVVPPSVADLYLSPKKDLSWTGLLEFVDDIVTDYSRPSPTVASTLAEDQNKDSSTSENVASPNLPKPFVKFVKPKDNQPESPEFVLNKKACYNCGDFSHLANNCRRKVQRETTRSQNHTYKRPPLRSSGHRPHGGSMRPSHRSSGHRPHGGSMRPSHRSAGHIPHGPLMNPRRPNMNAAEVPTGSDVVPTVSLVFATATVVTPYKRRKGKEIMVESETPKKKKVQKQIEAQVARELEEQMAREDQRMSKQVARDAEVARIHAEEELQMMINSLARSSETIEDFILIRSKEEVKRFKRKGIRFEKESVKKLKTSEEVHEEVKIPNEVPKEKVKEMMQLVPIEEVYVEALQVKHLIIDWKHMDREDLNQLWALVKESLSNRQPTSDKEIELWVELKSLYEPGDEDKLWTHTQNLMHALVEWKLYDLCRVHQLTSKDKEIFMLV
nr:hypothetical protein [Tanacetum cinerariifolium]